MDSDPCNPFASSVGEAELVGGPLDGYILGDLFGAASSFSFSPGTLDDEPKPEPAKKYHRTGRMTVEGRVVFEWR